MTRFAQRLLSRSPQARPSRTLYALAQPPKVRSQLPSIPLKVALGCVAVAMGLLLTAAPAHADFGINSFDVTYTAEQGENLTQAGPPQGQLLTQAGAHPFAMTTSFQVTSEETEAGGKVPLAPVRDVLFTQMPGFAGAPTAVSACVAADFLAPNPKNSEIPGCPESAVLGFVSVDLATSNGGKATFYAPVYNLVPSPGVTARLGFWITEIPITIDADLDEAPPYSIIAGPTNISQLVEFTGSVFTLWGVPADPAHDPLRGACLTQATGESKGDCPVSGEQTPFITMPRNCDGPLATSYHLASWPAYDPIAEAFAPALTADGQTLTHDDSGNPQGMTGCGSLAFQPEIAAQPTSRAATSPTGLDFSLDLEDEGIRNPDGLAGADIRKAEVTLPEGMSVNPSQAEGLAVCSEAQAHAERSFSAPGQGCPEASKIGSLELESPLLEGELLKGSLYIAAPYQNPFGSLLALYIVIKDPGRGVSVVQPAEVIADPDTGQLVTTTEEMPQIPFSHFRLHFKEGTHSPLVTPPSCDADPSTPGNQPYTTTAVLYPSSGTPPVTTTSTFEIISGPDNTPCPTGGLPPFHPGLEAGAFDDTAGAFSPFYVGLHRSDSEQEITHFSIKLPPGVVGKLAGVSTCPDAAIAAATARTGPLGGHEELASPSCPASSYVGRTLVGSGVGPSLAYAPGNVYLAGPYHGAPISIVAITAGVVGPFDIGTVVVREALRIDPETAEVFIDATGSDPIPHIIQGIPVHLRDIRVYTDRPEFVLNPTGCEPTSTSSTVLGSGLDFVSPADDNPVVVSTRFQAADCAALPFHPKLTFKLKGSTKRGGNPSLHAHVAMNGIGEAAIRYAQVALPRSEFLDNAHIGTICTRAQFREGTVPGERCPAASVYGHVSALTPILDGPLTGPIYLRSSEHELPDLVAALHHAEINVSLVGRVDSVKGGGIRNTFEFVPDAPVTSADFVFDGAAKGLLQNSTNLCKGTHKAKVKFKGHNGKVSNYKTPLKPTGCKGKKGNRHHRGH